MGNIHYSIIFGASCRIWWSMNRALLLSFVVLESLLSFLALEKRTVVFSFFFSQSFSEILGWLVCLCSLFYGFRDQFYISCPDISWAPGLHFHIPGLISTLDLACLTLTELTSSSLHLLAHLCQSCLLSPLVRLQRALLRFLSFILIVPDLKNHLNNKLILLLILNLPEWVWIQKFILFIQNPLSKNVHLCWSFMKNCKVWKNLKIYTFYMLKRVLEVIW